jgi:MFS family permease
MEWTRTAKRRGFVTSWPQFGVPAGLFLANLAVLAFNSISGDKFFAWGWRIPFILSAVLIAIGLWIRLGIIETPIFQKLAEQDKLEKTPVLEVIKRQPKPIVLSALARLAEQTPFYLFTAFVFSYGVEHLKVSRDLLLHAVLLFAVLELFAIPLAGHISDLLGRKRTYMLGAGIMFASGFAFFGLLDTGNPALIVLGIALGSIPHALLYGTQAALIAEQFTPRMRYSGASIGYQLASIIAGGPAPLIAAWLFGIYKSGTPIAIYICVCALIGFVASAFMTEYSKVDISEEYAHVGQERDQPFGSSRSVG